MNASAYSDLLNCSICFEVFTEPLILTNCGHTVCASCVKKQIDAPPTRRSVVCPECRTVSEVPTDGFKKNYRLTGIIMKVEESRDSGITSSNSLDQARISATVVDTSKFAGKWHLTASENIYAYLKEVGFGLVARIVATAVNIVLDIEVNGEHWKITETSLVGIYSMEFDLAKEFMLITFDGQKMKSTFRVHGAQLVEDRAKTDPNGLNRKTAWCLEDAKLVVKMETETGFKAKRIFERA